MPGQAQAYEPGDRRLTVAQNIPVQPEPQRVPMLDAGMLEDRTRPASKALTPIWLGHRLQSRDSPKASLQPDTPWDRLRRLFGPSAR